MIGRKIPKIATNTFLIIPLIHFLFKKFDIISDFPYFPRPELVKTCHPSKTSIVSKGAHVSKYLRDEFFNI